MNFEKLLYPRKEAAELLSISLPTLERMIARRELRIGRRVLIHHKELARGASCDHLNSTGKNPAAKLP